MSAMAMSRQPCDTSYNEPKPIGARRNVLPKARNRSRCSFNERCCPNTATARPGISLVYL